MFHIACTRFSNDTYKENKEYRKKYNIPVIYGPEFKIRNIYSPGSLLFVAEMNNNTNKIEGIGLIKNVLVTDKKYKMYQNNYYNYYIYRGNYWLSREQLTLLDSEINEILDDILFKGKSNLKRLSGITVLTDRLFTNWNYELKTLKMKIKTAFLTVFKDSNDIECEQMDVEGNSGVIGVPDGVIGVPDKVIEEMPNLHKKRRIQMEDIIEDKNIEN
jgi:hypothetical protein